MSEYTPKSTPPLVVDLGKVKRKLIKQLKQGRGELVSEVDRVVESVRSELGQEAEGKQILPVVLLYRHKAKRRRWFEL